MWFDVTFLIEDIEAQFSIYGVPTCLKYQNTRLTQFSVITDLGKFYSGRSKYQIKSNRDM